LLTRESAIITADGNFATRELVMSRLVKPTCFGW
jgi:hypothetical protein